MNWTEGYVSEVNYTSGFYGELSPLKLGLATLIKSIQPPDSSQEFTYCELACGQGFTTNILAATYPHAQFYANDFNPSHIATARDLATKAGMKNILFFDDSFEEFLERDLPQFDFISLHGIYSWISARNRQAIVNFIRRNLKVGGLVYISYNALPGWSAAMPMQALMLRHGQHSSESILTRIEQALNFTGELLEANASYFAQNPILKSRYERLKEQNRYYLAHEYFNQEWNSFYFDEVAKELEDAKLKYVGSAHINDHIDTVNLSRAAQEKLAKISDPIYREVVRDFFVNTQFRRDIFSRGSLGLTPQEQVKQLQETRFAMIVNPANIKFEQQFPVGEVKLQEAVYQPICQVLAESPQTLLQLQNHPKTSNNSLNSLYQALMILTGIGYIHPAVDEQTCQERKPSTNAFNNAVKTKAIHSEELSFLASPLIGTGVAVNRLEQLFLLAKSYNQDAVQFVWKNLASQGKKVVKDGKTLETEEENIAHLKTVYEEFSQGRLLTLQKLGIE
ncbi:MAG: methyltransferase regulatory domain-containing protein [Microcystis sp. M114S2]|jgi:SAM-dependent methyltransferase|uniref:methyltransferase regulatory domain-containing protein n=1 Tax=unclassified Microcystis TaxID=2643300 RepID=UPI002583629D|nr:MULTISPECIES: methyltransferase regulatory domain-containing protein [unclassified Microcystis]MCA2669332.1 methyltransferase regulatory domain-containing protein [Microcystis sp. M045S2]MCA2716027.1 methyltransferase regulatory domain-containing protein [Microcystis sp. M172S2]MCA2804613.1 methyltransferase regulatory domain-containing protein [Microcystis sp. M114S2]MCA2833650.1 methyltransferase regulatory domain-containing protein [Microcystis sp. M007S1]MCA2837660.1 methyltransferase r